jgi:glutamine amidotransferase
MIATILDYGAGNLHSLAKALDDDAIIVRVEQDLSRALETDLLVLPGVGSFAYASARLAAHRTDVRAAIRGGLPILGICLGMQLLFERSEEGDGDGLGILDGVVTRLKSDRIPHIGWNTLDDLGADGDFAAELRAVYYANSFACRPADESDVVAWTTHDGDRFPAAVRRGRTAGMQFHPEKSSRAGVMALRRVARAIAG